MEQVKAMSVQRDLEERYGPPRDFWKLLAGLFGMPVKAGQEVLHDPPVTTWTLVILVCIFSVAAFPNLEHWVQIFGLIPSHADRYIGGTVVTAFFLHAGVFHLVSNMYFLLIFGDKVEDTIGVARYLLLLFFATAFGGISHVALDPHHDIPVIGASGGIAGVMAFYAFRFPGVYLKFFIWTFFFWRWISVPVWGFFAFWIAMQAFGTLLQIAGFSSVSALGHLGGAAIGFLFYLEWRYVAERDLSEASPGETGD
jgi:membrane associated rhomboid family serine protease